MDEGDAGPIGGADIREEQGGAVEAQLPGVGGQDPREDLHQRALPRPVLADHRDDLAAADVEVHPVEGEDAGESLHDSVGGEAGGHSRPSFFARSARNSSRSACRTARAGTLRNPSAGATASAPVA